MEEVMVDAKQVADQAKTVAEDNAKKFWPLISAVAKAQPWRFSIFVGILLAVGAALPTVIRLVW